MTSSPVAIFRSAIGAPLTGLGPDWTGPGGIGDFAGKNGNTHKVVNDAHTLRNGGVPGRAGPLPADSGEVYDLVVVGCGFAGLTAALTYLEARPDARILMLDNHAIYGGEAKQNRVRSRRLPPVGAAGLIRHRVYEEPEATANLGTSYVEEVWPA